MADERTHSGNPHIFVAGNVGAINFGTILGNISQGLSSVGDESFTQAIQQLQTGIIASKHDDDWKQSMLEPLEFIVGEAQKKPEERKNGMARSLLSQLKSALAITADVATLVPVVLKVASYLGIQLS